MNEQTYSLLGYVLIEKYKSALNHLLIESFLFRTSLFVALILVTTVPMKFSPLGIAFPSLLLSLFWMLRIGAYSKEVSAFDERIVDYESKRQEDKQLASLYIYWRRDLENRNIYKLLLNYEPWVWSLIAIFVALVRNFYIPSS